MLHYDQTPRTYSMPGGHYVSIYFGPLSPKEKDAPIAYFNYPYNVEVEAEGVADHYFCISDEPSYLQLVPRLVDYMYKTLQLKLLIQDEFIDLNALTACSSVWDRIIAYPNECVPVA